MKNSNALSKINIEDLFTTVCKHPYCKVERNVFLRKQLTGIISPEQLVDALEKGTVNAGIPIHILDKIAVGAINWETTQATAFSTLAGIPGGLAMFGTVPADLAQFYAHIFRIAQKLAYIYGYKEIDLNDATKNVLMFFVGIMFGVHAANAALTKLAAANAAKIGARVARQPLTKYAIYNIAKKVFYLISIKLTKEGVGKAVTKAVPLAGGIVSGALTVATFSPMAKKLKNQLSEFAKMSPAALEKASQEADIILTDFVLAPDN